MIKYKAYSGKIEAVEITKETAHSVWMMSYWGREQRHNKMSSYECFFDSWDEAKDHIVNLAKGELDRATCNLEYAQGEYGKAIRLKPPTETP